MVKGSICMSDTTKADEQIEYHKTFPTGTTRLLVILRSFKFEIETGMRMSRKVPKCTSILRKEFGITGNPATQYYTFLGLLQKHGIVEFIDEASA